DQDDDRHRPEGAEAALRLSCRDLRDGAARRDRGLGPGDRRAQPPAGRRRALAPAAAQYGGGPARFLREGSELGKPPGDPRITVAYLACRKTAAPASNAARPCRRDLISSPGAPRFSCPISARSRFSTSLSTASALRRAAG